MMPLLGHSPEDAIVNVSSGVGILPMPRSPIYSATKAALHSWSISLRYQLRNTRIKVMEVLPLIVETGMVDALNVGGTKEKRMTVEALAEAVLPCVQC